MKAIIYRQNKSAMQSGRANSNQWKLKISTAPHSRHTDPLTGHDSGPSSLFPLTFPDPDSAIAYATANGLDYRLCDPLKEQIRKQKSYADNFSARRKTPWTH